MVADHVDASSEAKTGTGELGPSSMVTRREGTIYRFLSFLVGALLPFISWRTGIGYGAVGFQDRIAAVDVIALLFIFLLVLRGIKLTLPALLYGACLLISLFIANMLSTTNSEWSDVIVSAIALIVAYGYWVVGFNIGASKTLIKYLLAGLSFSLLIEFAIVLHDFLAPVPLFVDTMLERVRGTFRANGQLGAYGYAITGIALIVGLNWSKKLRVRFIALLMGSAAVFITIASSRRSAIISLFVWLIVYISISIFHFKFRHYVIIVLISIMVFAALSASFEEVTSSFTFQRLIQSIESLETGDNFTLSQFEAVIYYSAEWFPLGVGIGRWWNNYDIYELHNGHLALLVELGLMGFIFYYVMLLYPVALNRYIPTLIRFAIVSFIIASLVMMIHNRLHRDRTFMLTLGLLTNYTLLINSSSTKESDRPYYHQQMSL